MFALIIKVFTPSVLGCLRVIFSTQTFNASVVVRSQDPHNNPATTQVTAPPTTQVTAPSQQHRLQHPHNNPTPRRSHNNPTPRRSHNNPMLRRSHNNPAPCVMAKREASITLKDHKENFKNSLPCRLINPAKSEMGLVSKMDS